jgi:tetratricopeptide (TPR) repeat protein
VSRKQHDAERDKLRDKLVAKEEDLQVALEGNKEEEGLVERAEGYYNVVLQCWQKEVKLLREELEEANKEIQERAVEVEAVRRELAKAKREYEEANSEYHRLVLLVNPHKYAHTEICTESESTLNAHVHLAQGRIH